MHEIMSAIFLLAVLFLVLPSFLNTNRKRKQLTQNLFIWTIIVIFIVIIINRVVFPVLVAETSKMFIKRARARERRSKSGPCGRAIGT